jgi:hypothetical protein
MCPCTNPKRSNARSAATKFCAVLTDTAHDRSSSPTDELLESFAHYLRTERALAAGTVGLYVDHARRFLAGLDAEGWAGVTSGEVTRAVPCSPARPSSSPSLRNQKKTMITAQSLCRPRDGNQLARQHLPAQVGITRRSA